MPASVMDALDTIKHANHLSFQQGHRSHLDRLDKENRTQSIVKAGSLNLNVRKKCTSLPSYSTEMALPGRAHL